MVQGAREQPQAGRSWPITIVIQAEGMTYCQIVGMVTRREDSKLDDMVTSVKKVKGTAKGGLLLKMAKTRDSSTQALESCLEEILGRGSSVF